MRRKNVFAVAWAAASAGALGLGCKAPSAESAAAQVVEVDGSSTVFPISRAVAAEFELGSEARVSLAFSGTTAGFRKLCAGEIDIAMASRPIRAAEAASCKSHRVSYVELPVGYDGLAVLVNPSNDWANDITTAELKRLWEPDAQGKVTHWNQIRDGWPAREIHLVGAGADSGTYDYFTEAIVGASGSSRKDYTASEDDTTLVAAIAADPLALGFFGFAYYSENRSKLKLLGIDDGKAGNGEGPVAPSKETVRNGTYQPLSRPLFLYVAEGALARPQVASFCTFYLASAPRIVDEVAYLPLPQEAYVLARARLQEKRTGSLFGERESHIGVAIESLLAKEQADTAKPSP